MPKAILFDLDGTLISDSMDAFLPPYFSALTKKLAHLIAPEKLVAQLNVSTHAMVANTDPTRTLADTFAADFFPKIGLPRETLMPLLDDFYEREYRELRAFVNPIPEARAVVSRAVKSRVPIVIATMPVFPLIAVQQRLEWGKLADFPYKLITAYENMCASKPHAAYYREIAQKIECTPEDCIMVGNEVQNDILPAKRAGMKTFWVTDTAFMATDVPADWRGTLTEFGELLERGDLDPGTR